MSESVTGQPVEVPAESPGPSTAAPQQSSTDPGGGTASPSAPARPDGGPDGPADAASSLVPGSRLVRPLAPLGDLAER